MRLRFLFPLVGLVTCSLMTVACTDDGTDDEGAGGAGGEATNPSAGRDACGEPGTSGSPGAGGDCATDGSGTVVLEVTGLPEGVAPDVELVGPDTRHPMEAGTLEDVGAGEYTIKANRVFDEDPTVRTVFDATVTTPSVCVGDGSTTVKVTYAAIPTSNKLWMPTGLDDEGAAFGSDKLLESATTAASVTIDGEVGKSIAFDRDGNLWTLGNNAQVRRYSAGSLATSGTKTPDVSFTLPEIDCVPGLSSLALDASGNLWLSSSCADMVVRVPAADLSGTDDEEKMSDVLIAGALAADGLAFDRAGNLWVGGGTTLLRYDASRLDEPTGDPADLTIQVKDGEGDLMAAYLAFDKAGNLWSVPLAGPLFQLAAADLEGTGTKDVDANVSIALDVLALAHQPAFDDGNGLWLSWTDGTIARLSPEQLGTSAGPGKPVSPEVLVKSSSVGTSMPFAFFPAPQGLPLYHSIPEE